MTNTSLGDVTPEKKLKYTSQINNVRSKKTALQ
jgi:hypothetical protein